MREGGGRVILDTSKKSLCETTVGNGSLVIEVLNGVVYKSLSIDRVKEFHLRRGESQFVRGQSLCLGFAPSDGLRP